MRLTYLTSNNAIEGLKITRLENGSEPNSITFSKFDISHLTSLLEFIKAVNLTELTSRRLKLGDDYSFNNHNKIALESILNSDAGFGFLKEFFQSNNDLTQEDLVNLSYRKKQVETFKAMLESNNDEKAWQNFFENNHWIFGYGLDFVFHESLLNKKLEQYTSVSNFNAPGFEIDALMKARSAISNLCLCEIKRPDTKLLAETSKRSGTWHINSSVYEAIAQIQKNVFQFQQTTESRMTIYDKKGSPTGEELYLIKPKAYLIVGSLSQFKDELGTNFSKLSSFELFRRNLISPEIITYDELYERAKAIVENSIK